MISPVSGSILVWRFDLLPRNASAVLICVIIPSLDTQPCPDQKGELYRRALSSCVHTLSIFRKNEEWSGEPGSNRYTQGLKP